MTNRTAELLFAYEQGELKGKALELLVPDSLRHRHIAQRHRYLQSPRARPLVSGLDLRALRKDGSEFDAEISLTPIKTADGSFVCSIVRDISGDKYSEAYFRNVLESAPDAIVIIDHGGKIAVINEQAERMFGYSRADLLGRNIETLVPTTVRERHISHRNNFLKDPKLRPMGTGLDLRGVRSDGTEFPVEISLSPLETASGRFVSSAIRDVTRRKEMEHDLISARQDAERANKANTAFLAAASHDLRQPVQALTLLTGALRRTVGEHPLALEMIDSQQTSLDAMTNLLNSLLDISRLDAGKVAVELQDFRIQRLIDNLSTEFARQAQHKGLTFEAAGCEQLSVRSDQNLLSEIIQNLVGNAIRYTDQGRIAVSCHDDGEHLWIAVSDTGVGIDSAHFDEIFQEFHQLKVPGREKEGFGLGLAIVRRLADLLVHEVTVTSEKGKGSTFSVRVPLAPNRRSAPVNGKEESRVSALEDVHGTILLIEDDVQVARAWLLLMRAEGFRVSMAEAVSDLDAIMDGMDSPPDLIISDYHLQDGSNGIDAIAVVRERYGRLIPALIVTGDTSKLVVGARHTENCLILNKPVHPDQLLLYATKAVKTGTVEGG